MIRSFKIITAILVASCFIVTATTAAIEIPLKYGRCPAPDREGYHPHDSRLLDKALQAPAGEWKLPKLNSKMSIYSETDMAGKKRLFLFDCKESGYGFYDRVYFDANGNRDLTDDPIIEADNSNFDLNSANGMVRFPKVDSTLTAGGKEFPYSFYIYVRYTGRTSTGELTKKDIQDDGFSIGLGTNCWYEGEFDLDGQHFQLVLADSNANGKFDDVPTIPKPCTMNRPDGDRLFLTSEEKLSYNEYTFFGNLLQIKEKLYSVSHNPSENKLILKPAKREGFVPVELSMEVERLSIYTDDGSQGIMMCKPSGKLEVPPGNYRVAYYQAVRKDEEGDVWSTCAAGTKDSPLVNIGKNGGDLKFGEPYVAYASIPEEAYRNFNENENSEVPIEFRLEGSAGELVEDLRRISGENTKIPLSESRNYRSKEPSYKIVKSSGELVAEGTFRYG